MIATQLTRGAFLRASLPPLVAFAAVLSTPQRTDRGSVTSRIETVQVVVAAKDMEEGVTIDRAALVVAQWPTGTQPVGSYSSVDAVVGGITSVRVYRGEAIVSVRLTRDGTGAGLEVRITPGKRAYGVRIDDAASVAGMVQPNSRVDIMVLINEEKGQRVAKLVMENMRVLAIGAAEPRAGRPISGAIASIEVTPSEAERLAIAAAQGSLQLALRGYGDADSVTTTGAVLGRKSAQKHR